MNFHKLARNNYVQIALFLAAAAVLLLWEPLFTWPANQYIGGDEIAAMFIPWLSFILDSVRQYGQLPLWNPYLFSGVPFAANPQPMMFYPFTYLGLLMPLTRAIALTLAIHIWLGGMGMYGWLRSLGATHSGAFLAGVAFAFTGEFMLRVGMGHYGIALQLAWWPLSFWVLQHAFDRRSWRWAILAGVPLAMALLSGHTATCLLLYVALGAYTAFQMATLRPQHPGQAWSARARVGGLAALAVAMSFALAAVQYLPLFTFSQLSVRAVSPSLDFSARFSMPVGHLLTLLVPDFFGEVIRTGTWSVEGYEEITYYVGAFVFLLVIIGAQLASKQKRLLFFLVMAVGAVLLQLGPDGVLFVLFYRFVPGFALTRAPGRAGLIYLFAMISAAGWVWSELERASQETRQRLLSVFDKTLVWAVSMLTLGAALIAFIFYAALKPSDAAWTWHLGGRLTQFLVLFWTSMALFAAVKNGLISHRAATVMAVGIVLFDLWGYGLKSIRPGPDSLGRSWPEVASYMQDKHDYRSAAEDFEFFELNGPLAYHLRGHYGYDPLVLAHYQALLGSAPDYFDRVYDLLNIKYIITRNPIDLPKKSNFKLNYNTYDLKIYRRPDSLPRAFIVHDVAIVPEDAQAIATLRAADFEISRTVTLPAQPPCTLETPVVTDPETAQVVNETPNHLELTTYSTAGGLLVLSEVEYPGWEARVDGQPAQVLRADVALRAICLPAGSHTVQFDFRPRDFVAGAIISGLALGFVIVISAWLLVSARRTRRN